MIGANSPVSFYGGATILGGTFGLNGGSQLEVRSTVFLNGGAFSGSGELKVFAPGRLQLALGASVGVGVVNQGGIVEMGPAISHATVESFSQNIFGTLEVGISGTPGSGSYDVLTVSDTASLAGTLKVAFNVPGASPGDTWQILAADTIVNGFNSIQVTGVPAGQKLIAHQTDTGLYLKLTADLTYAGWASAKGLIPPNDDLAKDGDGDGVANAFEAILGGGPSSNDSDLLSAPFLLNVSGTNYLAIALPLAPATTINDLNILAVRSDDLQTWNTSNVVLHSTTFDAMVCIETRVYRSTVPASSQTNEFLRFDVQLIPP